MGRQDWDREWAGLEPPQPRRQGLGCWLGALAIALVALFICVAGVLIAWRELGPVNGGDAGPPTPPVIMTLPTPLPTSASPATAEANPAVEATVPPMAATATLVSSGADNAQTASLSGALGAVGQRVNDTFP